MERGEGSTFAAVDSRRQRGKPPRVVRRSCFSLLIASVAVSTLVAVTAPCPAHAQYKNNQFGFEGGYMYIGDATGLDPHSFLIGMRAAYKVSDHWWFSARAGLSFRGDDPIVGGNRSNTVVLFHLVPVEARYYFLTDFTRPFVGVSNSFQFLTNQQIDASVFWGPGVTAGIEFRLRRDLFIGFQADAYYMIAFGVDDAPLATFTTQINFFL